jgi:LuxR family maltose regulon positive regulatory protein
VGIAMFEVMLTKLLPPKTRDSLIERPRLQVLLSEVEHRKAAFITAPAGYGKTIVIQQYTGTLKSPFVWYQLDTYDNDPVVFFQYFIMGVQQFYPDFGQEALQIIQQGNLTSRLRLILVAIVNEFAKQVKNGLIIILDDFHLITEPVIHRFLQELIQNLPSSIHLIIASRLVPPFSLYHLIPSGEILNIATEELKFNYSEIAALISGLGREFSEPELQMLETKTVGWPVALRLAGDLAVNTAKISLNQGNKQIYDYLAAEVFIHQPQDIQEFLLATSVLETLTAKDCDWLLECPDSEQKLDFIERQQLFLTSLSGPGKAYKYHKLFRDFLQEWLGNKRVALLQRAGIMARQSGKLDQAVEYLIAAGTDDQLDQILREAGQEALHRGQWQTVARWLEVFSKGKLATDPWLSLYQAQIELYRGRLAEAENWADKANTCFKIRQDQVGMAENQIIQAKILRLRGKHQESLYLLEQAVDNLPEMEAKQRFDLPLERFWLLFMMGRFKEADLLLNEALKAIEATHDGYTASFLMEALGTTHYMLGNYSRALDYYKKGTQISPARTLPGYYSQDSISSIYMDWGELDYAFTHAKRNLEIKEKLGLTDLLPSAYLQLASIYVARGELQLGEANYHKAIALITENAGERFFLVLNLVFLAQCLGLQNRWLEARGKVEEALVAAGEHVLTLAICQSIGSPAFIQTGNFAEGEAMLLAAEKAQTEMGLLIGVFYCHTTLAWYYFKIDSISSAKKYALKALELASRLNLLQYFVTSYSMLHPVLRYGLEQGIEVTFIQKILTRVGESALELLLSLSSHPDPGVRSRVIFPLAEIGGDRAKNIFESLMSDCDMEVRQVTRMVAERFEIAATSENITNVPLQISTLGRLRIFYNGSELNGDIWRTVKTRDLFVYLVHRTEPISKDLILEDLWPDLDSENSSYLFHTSLYNLRQLLSRITARSDLIVYHGKHYQLLSGSFNTDKQRFETMIASSSNSDGLTENMIVNLEKAVELYQGDYLVELDYPWLIPFREHLKRLYLEARLNLAKSYISKQEYASTITNLHFLLEKEPLSEEAHTLLMRAYAGQGERLAVVKQYQTLGTILKKELGLDLSFETKALFEKICSGLN